MPLYEYICGDCGRTFERIRSAAVADEEVQCGYCGGVGARRAVSRFFSVSKGGNGNLGASSGGCASCSASSCASCKAR